MCLSPRHTAKTEPARPVPGHLFPQGELASPEHSAAGVGVGGSGGDTELGKMALDWVFQSAPPAPTPCRHRESLLIVLSRALTHFLDFPV